MSRPTSKSAIRCIGLELGGGKSARTAFVVLDYFPKEKRVFIVDTKVDLQGDRESTGDEVLLEELKRHKAHCLTVSAPLSLPPCIQCKLACPGYKSCKVPAVRWMREEAKRLKLRGLKSPTPYTQRPIDLLLRGRMQEHIGVEIPIDETLGAGPAPLTARFQYLQRHLKNLEIYESHPRLVMARLADWYGFSARQLKRYRDIQEGLEFRLQLLRAFGEADAVDVPQLFLYEEDRELFARELGLFDALLSGLMSVFQAAGLCEEVPKAWQKDWAMSLLPERRERPVVRRSNLLEST